ncbi:hypothetical protein HID58_057789 [Brassica napus]|uniref:Uncharacterized protein n=1 Tax=Brassica napus TaxID=3708 RepID=A0ABQ7XFP7_BRANA|nr:hypothetical protein HID58_057789 [Brassica napus]
MYFELHLLGLGQSFVVFDVVFRVVGLPSIVSARLGFHDMTAPRFADFVLSLIPSMFAHLVEAFIAACVSVALPFAMFVIPDLDSGSYFLAGGCDFGALDMCFLIRVSSIVILTTVTIYGDFLWHKLSVRILVISSSVGFSSNLTTDVKKTATEEYLPLTCLISHGLLLHNSSFMRSLEPKKNGVYLDSSQKPIKP